MSPRYAIEVVGKAACGCTASLEFELDEGEEPGPGDVGAIMYSALDPEISNLLEFLMNPEHAPHGTEKVTVTAQIKVR